MVKNSRKKPDSNPKLKLQKLVLSKQQNSFDKITIEISDISENINTTSKKSKKFLIKKGQWTPQEDKLLEHWVRVNGPKDWEDCGRFIQGRKGKQCREHWNNCLNPDLLKGNWTPEEDFLIMFFYQKCKGSWKKIIPLFNGRIENSIKNRFYSQLRKYATKNMCAKDRKRLSPKIKLNELKNYINEAIIEAKTDFLYKSKMSKEEFNLFVENNEQKIKEHISIEDDNLESNSNTNYERSFTEKEMTNIFLNKKRKSAEDDFNINDNYLSINDSEFCTDNKNSEDLIEFDSKSVNKNVFCCLDNISNVNNNINFNINIKDSHGINDDSLFNNIYYYNYNNNDEQSINRVEYKNNNFFLNNFKKENYKIDFELYNNYLNNTNFKSTFKDNV